MTDSILVAEDAARDREFLASVLADYHLELVGDGAEAMERVTRSPYRYVISDLQMPRTNGIELARQVWRVNPDARIIFWSNYKDEIYLRSLAGIIPPDTVYGFVLKDSASEVIEKAVQQVFREHQCWIDPAIRAAQARTQRGGDTITDAEYDVLVDIALGLTDNVIARRHYLSRRGVQNRLRSIYQKLNLERSIFADEGTDVINPRARAVSIAFQRGLINRSELEEEELRLKQWVAEEQ